VKMKEKILGFFTGFVDAVIRFINKGVAVIDALLDTVVKLAGNPKQFIWVIVGIVVAWDVLKGGAFGSINFLLTAIMDVATKIVALVAKGGWELVGAAVAVAIIVSVIKKDK